MFPFRFHFLRAAVRRGLPWLVALTFASQVHAADATPTPSDEPAATPPTIDVEAPDTPPPAPTPGPRASRFPQLLGIFRDVHLRAHESTDQVVTVFGDAIVEGRVDDQVVTVFGNADLRHRIDGDVVVVFGNGSITHDVDGDVVWLFGTLTISPGVTINGDLFAIGGETLRDETVFVEGERFEFSLPGLPQFGSWVRECLIVGRLYRHDRASTWVFIGAMLALSLLLAAVFRGPVQASVSVLERSPGVAFLNGLLAVLLIPPALVLLVSLVISIPVVPFLIVGLMFATWVGVIAVSRHCGAQIGVGANPALAFIVGFLLLALLFAVPVIGLLTWSAVMMLGMGTAMTAWLESRRRDNRAAKAQPAVTATATTATTAPLASVTSGTPPPAPYAPAAPIVSDASPQPFTTASFVETPAPGAEPPPMPAAPAPAAAPRLPAVALERVGMWPRILANLLDLVAVSATLGITGLPFAFVYVWFAYHVAFWAWRGTTLGGVVMNLRIERLDGRPLDANVAVARALGAIMSFVALGFGFLWVEWDPEKQSWHDKIAGTVVVRVPRGQSLI